MRRNGLLIMLKLITLVGSFFFVMVLAILNGAIGNLCASGVMIFASLGVAKVIGENVVLPFGWIIALTIGCGILRGILRYFEQYSNHYIAFKLLAIIRDKIFTKLRILAPAKLESKKKGSIISLLTADIETLEVFYAHTISPIAIALISSITIIIFVSIISSIYLGLVALISYLIIGVLLPIISSKALKSTGVKYRNEFASFSAYFLDSIKGVKEIILNNSENRRKEEINKRSTKLFNNTTLIKRKSSISFGITEVLVSLSIIVSLIVGIILVNNNELTLGFMIIGVVAITSSFGPIIAISSLPSNLTQTFASGDRVLNLMEEAPQVIDVSNKNDFKYEKLDVNNLDFKYDNELILKDINLNINKGEIVGIVGESGCGKSTLLKLLLRFYESKGIKYNDIDINEINTNSLYENVTMASQTTYLFDDTILYNLKIAKEDASEEEIIEACKKASIHDFIMSLPDGYNTKVGPTLNNLSAGEKQRIGLARCFLRGSELILLDEVTSNVDAINEGIILKSLKDLKNEKTIILVSHRKSTMAIADRIYEIDKGRIIEYGR
ncbi:MAG: ABC transporter ATP-binding protein [Acholeplasmatales bacterium]|nr:ABC transporter ATP-binding protein [Acholeplasmatales bacterium]